MYLPFNPKLKTFARNNRNNATQAEEKIWYVVLANKKLGYRFLRQKPIGDFIVDFYCSKLKLVIEVDGDDHAEKTESDFKRTEFLKGLGLKIIRYKNLDILRNIAGVYDDLVNEVGDRVVVMDAESQTPRPPC